MLSTYRGLRWLLNSFKGLSSADPVEVAVARRVWAFLIPLGFALVPIVALSPSLPEPQVWIFPMVVVAYPIPFASGATVTGRRVSSSAEVFWFQVEPPRRVVLERGLRQILVLVWSAAVLNGASLALHQIDALTASGALVTIAATFAVLAPPAAILGLRGRRAWRGEGQNDEAP